MSELSETTLQDYDRLRKGAIRVDLSAWSLLELTGEDRKGWLQGQATNEIKTLTPGSGRSFCLCEPTGGLLAVVDAWALPDRIVMTTERARAASVLDRVERMTILEDVAARDLSEKRVAFSIQGPAASRELSEMLTLPTLDAGTAPLAGSEAWVLRSRRTGMGGWDVWLPASAEEARATLTRTFSQANSETFEAARLEAGVPRWGEDMGPRTLPPELGSAFESRHVSYSKGCYTGQEVLMRLHSRGHTNRTWVGLVAEKPLEIGATVLHRGKGVGTVTSAAVSPDFGPIAAAVLRNEATLPGEPVKVGEVEAEVRPMPILRFD